MRYFLFSLGLFLSFYSLQASEVFISLESLPPHLQKKAPASTTNSKHIPTKVFFANTSEKSCKEVLGKLTHISKIIESSRIPIEEDTSGKPSYCILTIPIDPPMVYTSLRTTKSHYESIEAWDGEVGKFYHWGSRQPSEELWSQRVLNLTSRSEKEERPIDIGDVLLLGDGKGPSLAEVYRSYLNTNFPENKSIVVKSDYEFKEIKSKKSSSKEEDCNSENQPLLENSEYLKELGQELYKNFDPKMHDQPVAIFLDNGAKTWDPYLGSQKFDTIVMKNGLCTCSKGTGKISCGGIGESDENVKQFFSNILRSLKLGGRAVLQGSDPDNEFRCRKRLQYERALHDLSAQMKVGKLFRTEEGSLVIYLEAAGK